MIKSDVFKKKYDESVLVKTKKVYVLEKSGNPKEYDHDTNRYRRI